MLLNVECKKCQSKFQIDIGNDSIEQTKEKLSKMDTFSFCPGHHVEISSPINYLILNDIVPGKALTDKEWLKAQKKNTSKKLMTKDQVEKLFICDGFSYGLYCGHNKKTNEKVVLDFITSPSGVRYYF